MNPYRGHPTPIEAVCALENNYNLDSTIVSGDDSGNVFTWNWEVDEDDVFLIVGVTEFTSFLFIFSAFSFSGISVSSWIVI